MQFAAHKAELLRSGPDGIAERARLEASAKLGNEFAIKKLQWPRFPESLDYLYRWFEELDAGRGESMNGLAPITHEQVEAWSRLMSVAVEPHEVAALLSVDRVYRAAMMARPEESKPATSTPGEQAHADIVRPKWPTKKVAS